MSPHTQNDPMDLASLERLVDAYGSRLDRWPAALRPGAEQLLLRDAQAAALVAEARALEAILDAAPRSGALDTSALVSRITAAAVSSRTEIAPSRATGPTTVTVIPLGRSAGRPGKPALRQAATWQAAAALAASLVLGLALGATGIASTSVERVAEAIGLDVADQSVLALASEDTLEDLL